MSTVEESGKHFVHKLPKDHQCHVTPYELKRKEICDKIRKAALTSRQHPSQIIQEITNNTTQSAMLHAPSKLALTRLVQR